MLIINDYLNKRFCKKVFVFNISFFKKCYVHDIFTINFHNIVNLSYSNIFYSFNIYIYILACPHNEPTHFPFLFLFLFFPSVLAQSQEPTLHLLSSFFFSFSTFLYTINYTAHTHALLHLDLLYSFLFL